MTDNEIKMAEWLKRGFYAKKKLETIELLLKQCKENAEGLTRSQSFNDSGRSDTRINTAENKLLKLAETEQQYTNEKNRLLKISAEISDAISQLHNDDLEAVLIHRYLLFHTVEQTAELLNYSDGTIKRKHKKAIKKLCEQFAEQGEKL